MFLLEYDTPDFVNLIDDVGGVAIALTALSALVVGIAKIAVWLDKRQDDKFAKKVKEIVEPIILDATKEIHSDANGGHSLNDLHKRMTGIERALNIDTGGERTNAEHY